MPAFVSAGGVVRDDRFTGADDDGAVARDARLKRLPGTSRSQSWWPEAPSKTDTRVGVTWSPAPVAAPTTTSRPPGARFPSSWPSVGRVPCRLPGAQIHGVHLVRGLEHDASRRNLDAEGRRERGRPEPVPIGRVEDLDPALHPECGSRVGDGPRGNGHPSGVGGDREDRRAEVGAPDGAQADIGDAPPLAAGPRVEHDECRITRFVPAVRARATVLFGHDQTVRDEPRLEVSTAGPVGLRAPGDRSGPDERRFRRFGRGRGTTASGRAPVLRPWARGRESGRRRARRPRCHRSQQHWHVGARRPRRSSAGCVGATSAATSSRFPSSSMVAGTRTSRTTVASIRTAAAIPTPSILIAGFGFRVKIRNTKIITSAAEVMTRAGAGEPDRHGLAVVAGALVLLADAREQEQLVVHRQPEQQGEHQQRDERHDVDRAHPVRTGRRANPTGTPRPRRRTPPRSTGGSSRRPSPGSPTSGRSASAGRTRRGTPRRSRRAGGPGSRGRGRRASRSRRRRTAWDSNEVCASALGSVSLRSRSTRAAVPAEPGPVVGSTSEIAAVNRSLGIGIDACATPGVCASTCPEPLGVRDERATVLVTLFSRRRSSGGICTTTISGPFAPGPSCVGDEVVGPLLGRAGRRGGVGREAEADREQRNRDAAARRRCPSAR